MPIPRSNPNDPSLNARIESQQARSIRFQYETWKHRHQNHAPDLRTAFLTPSCHRSSKIAIVDKGIDTHRQPYRLVKSDSGHPHLRETTDKPRAASRRHGSSPPPQRVPAKRFSDRPDQHIVVVGADIATVRSPTIWSHVASLLSPHQSGVSSLHAVPNPHGDKSTSLPTSERIDSNTKDTHFLLVLSCNTTV